MTEAGRFVATSLNASAGSRRPQCRPATDFNQPLAVRLRAVEACRLTFGVASAQALWFAIGLPIVPAMCRPAAQTEMPFDLNASAVGGHG